MRSALLFVSVAAATAAIASGSRGIVGISVDRAVFTVVTSVLPDSPAAEAGIQVGDRVIAIGGFPTSKLQTIEEFISRVSGPLDSEVELELKRGESGSPFRVRLRRITPPSQTPFKPPGDFNPEHARSQPMV